VNPVNHELPGAGSEGLEDPQQVGVSVGTKLFRRLRALGRGDDSSEGVTEAWAQRRRRARWRRSEWWQARRSRAGGDGASGGARRCLKRAAVNALACPHLVRTRLTPAQRAVHLQQRHAAGVMLRRVPGACAAGLQLLAGRVREEVRSPARAEQFAHKEVITFQSIMWHRIDTLQALDLRPRMCRALLRCLLLRVDTAALRDKSGHRPRWRWAAATRNQQR
jgi:hypothetical protein